MDMLSNWWGGKPAKNISDDKNTKPDPSSSGEAETTDQKNDDVAPSPAQDDTAPVDTAGNGAGSSSEEQKSDVAENESDDKKQTFNEAEKSDTSENQGTSDPLGGLTKMTKEEAAEAAEAALNSAYNFGSFLFKKVSDTASKTATIIQKTVEEQTIVGDFSREQKKFVKEKHSKRSEAAVPPWVGYNEEEQMKEQILALSQDKRNFMRNPPAGVQFHFDYNTIHPIAMATLQEDSNLQKMRFALVPKKITEENFWRNYFYRVSLIKQSSQLTSLATKSGDERRRSGSASHSSDEGSSLKGDKTPPIDVKSAPNAPAKPRKSEDEQLEIETPDSPPGSEFISDAFNSELDEDDLMKGMEQLGMDKKDGAEEEVPQWEKELQQELQDFEVVGEEGNEEWEREINQMLEDEVDKES